ncbi:MAG: GFA family protein [Alphaproteobacteria bacterium]
MRVNGRCHCGQITFEAEIDPDRVRICHCADCQMLSGSAFRVSAPTAEANFRLLGGTPKLYVKTADSGAQRVQAFCADCGTQIYATSAGDTDRTFGIRVGTLRQRAQLAPKRQFWCSSRLPWLPVLPGTPLDRQ